MQGIDIRLRASCPGANRSGYAHCDEDAHFARRQAFGLDDIDGPTHYVEHAAKTLFLVLVTLTEQKWVTLAECRGFRYPHVKALSWKQVEQIRDTRSRPVPIGLPPIGYSVHAYLEGTIEPVLGPAYGKHIPGITFTTNELTENL